MHTTKFDIAVHVKQTYFRDGMLALPDGTRDLMIEFLEMLLTREDSLLLYSAEVLGGDNSCEQEPFEPLTAKERDQLMCRNWHALSDNTIAALLVSPTTLSTIGRELWENLSPKWSDVFDRAVALALDWDDVSQNDGQCTGTTTRKAHVAFRNRMLVDAEAIPAINRLPDEFHARVIAQLSELVKRMAEARDRKSFNALDTDFHTTIAKHYFNDNVKSHQTRKAFARALAFLHKYGLKSTESQMPELAQAAACREHADIVSALQARNDDAAVKAAYSHLDKSFRRWFPMVNEEIANTNRRYFDELTTRDLQIVGTLNVIPVELDDRYPSTRQAAIRAILRGVTLVYLVPSKRLLGLWRERIPDIMITDNYMEEAFQAFRDDVNQASNQHQDWISRRLFQIQIDTDSFFDYIKINRSIGYASIDGGADVVTRRDYLCMDNAWPEIASWKISKQNQRRFRSLIRDALTNVKNDMSRSDSDREHSTFVLEFLNNAAGSELQAGQMATSRSLFKAR